MTRRALMMLTLLMLSACANAAKDEWANIDYERIARDNQRRENDNAYTPPLSVIGCVDDDLYNCNPRRGR
jgi:hypothetical protein